MQADLTELENRLWDAADELRANSGLKASEYASPVLGLIFLRFADARFEAARERVEAKGSSRRKIGPSDYQAEGLIYLAPKARYGTLLDLPEGSDLGKAVNDAMRLVEKDNPDLKGILPRSSPGRRSRAPRPASGDGRNARLMKGLDHDLALVKPANADGFVNWLTTHLSGAIGKPAVMKTRARVESLGGRLVCRDRWG